LNKKEYLQQYKTLDNYINRKVEELEKWKALATKITPIYSDMPHGSGSNDKIQSAVENIILLEIELDKSIDEFVNLKREIESKINAVDDGTLRLLLQYRYIDGKTWEQIAVDMFYTYKWVCKLHGDALSQIKI